MRKLFAAMLMLVGLLAVTATSVWAVPTVTSLNILSAHSFSCVSPATAITCVPGAGTGDILYVVHYRINGTPGANDFAGQYFFCRLNDTVTGDVLGQVDAASKLGTSDPDGKGFPEGVCSFYLSEEEANPVSITLAGKPSAFAIPPSTTLPSGAILPHTNGRIDLPLVLALTAQQSIAGQLQFNLVLADSPLIVAAPDDSIRFTDLGATYFMEQIPGLQSFAPQLLLNSAQDSAIIDETADFSFQTGLRAMWAGTQIGASFEAVNTLLHFPTGSTWGSSVIFLLVLMIVFLGCLKAKLSMPLTLWICILTLGMGALSGFILMVWLAIPALGGAALVTGQFFELKRQG